MSQVVLQPYPVSGDSVGVEQVKMINKFAELHKLKPCNISSLHPYALSYMHDQLRALLPSITHSYISFIGGMQYIHLAEEGFEISNKSLHIWS